MLPKLFGIDFKCNIQASVDVVVVFLLSGLYNLVNTRYIRMHDQIVIAYCGLRGAVCFCLVHMIDGQTVGPRELFNTTVIIVILWTVFVQVLI